MDPITQIFQQARAPSGSGNDIFDAYKFGAQQAQQTRQLNLQEEAQRIALQEQGLNIQMKRDQLERNNQVKAGEGELLKLLIEVGNDPQGWGNVQHGTNLENLLARNSALGMTPTGQSAVKNYLAYGEMKRGFARVKELAGEYNVPLRELTTDAQGNPRAKFGAAGSNYMQGLIQTYNDLIDSGDPDNLAPGVLAAINKNKTQEQQADTRLKLGEQNADQRARNAAGSNFEKGITITPKAGGGYDVIQGPRPLTAGGVKENQDALSSALAGVRQLRALQPLVNAHTFGPQAYIERNLIDKGLANIYPELLNKDRPSSEILAGQIRAVTIRALRSDSNITKTEQEALADLVPNTEEFLNSPARAFAQIEALNKGVIERAVRSARNLHQPIPDELTEEVPGDLVIPLVQEKLLSPDQARRWYQKNRIE